MLDLLDRIAQAREALQYLDHLGAHGGTFATHRTRAFSIRMKL
ncbi:unknown protein [Azorhizobium caulinodans ORS 571]|uniref:Uncharacterized protein n=1 Tax=Azorhizobium caulinodans (strain ATCC 43989 / DSM 5975 / JCM 20966 / LMG 6465 / NBRC 14845 / NCIMB 13405 / ORS 571) TaxID=438753 RepID=A8IG59_AZOC5|nr:unknown protein [Azorhizobium caulinodans ORS 571]